MTDTQKTLDWLNEVCEQAYTESRSGDTAFLNTLTGKSKAIQYYFINVHRLKTLTPEQFGHQFPQYLKEAEQIRREVEAVDKVDAQESRLTSIEEQLGELKSLLQSFIEAQQKPAEKRSGKKIEETKQPEPEVETAAEDKDADSAESEA